MKVYYHNYIILKYFINNYNTYSNCKFRQKYLVNYVILSQLITLISFNVYSKIIVYFKSKIEKNKY